MNTEGKKTVGRAAVVDFPEMDMTAVPARIDTGARLSSIWAAAEERGGSLLVTFFGPQHPQYNGEAHEIRDFEQVVVASSMGHAQKRYKVKLLVKLKGKKIRAQFTLADRSSQVYPVLIGRNVLRGKFIVDVKTGHSLKLQERQRAADLQAKIDEL